MDEELCAYLTYWLIRYGAGYTDPGNDRDDFIASTYIWAKLVDDEWLIRKEHNRSIFKLTAKALDYIKEQ